MPAHLFLWKSSKIIRTMRFPPIDRFLLLIVTLGLCATLVELVLEEHTESFFQWIPIGLIAAALGALAWNQITQGAASGRGC